MGARDSSVAVVGGPKGGSDDGNFCPSFCEKLHEDGMDCAIENTRSVGPCAGDVHTTSALSWTLGFWDDSSHPPERRTLVGT